MGKFGKLAGVAAIALGASICALPAQAAVNLELGLAIDGSGSMSVNEFNLQKQAYINVLSDTSVLARDGTVAIGVKVFSNGITNVFAMAAITNANFSALITALTNMTRPGDDTNITGVISAFNTEITTNGIDSVRRLIDISTDGENTVGTTTALNNARDAANAAGITINCIGIGQNCDDVSQGPDSFTMRADDFDDFEDALRRKIVREVHGAVPEPMTWIMMIGGFALVGFSMRRRNVKVSFA